MWSFFALGMILPGCIARRWWPRLTNVYTPVGWKNHLFRFNVYYDGTVMADPAPEHSIEALREYDDVGMQLSIMPSEGGLDPYRWRAGTLQMTTDGGRRWGYQGLLDRPTPVIWTEWRQSFRSAVGPRSDPARDLLPRAPDR